MSFIRPIYISDGERPAFSQQRSASRSQEFVSFSSLGKYEETTPLHAQENIPGSYPTPDYGIILSLSNALRELIGDILGKRAADSFAVQAEVTFDFGSGAPLPTAKAPKQVPVRSDERRQSEIYDYKPFASVRPRKSTGNFQSLWQNRDGPLLSYLAARKVSQRFLVEIDIFLENHPEILVYASSFADKFNNSTPLEAYQFFVRGYTRPARYIAGTLDRTFKIPALLPRLVTAYDEELTKFFEGYDYRYDILQRIDEEMAMLGDKERRGEHITYDERILVAYVAFGNPVDAFKQFEYNYQTDWLPHRYLPEHVVLSELPAYAKKSQPQPRTNLLTDVRTTYPVTRRNMAAANDAGVDPIDVLMDDFIAKLVKKGCTRKTVMELEEKARRAIDEQRQHGLGDDIVDLVMDLVDSASWRIRLGRSQKLRRSANGPSQPEQPTPREPAVPKQRRAQMHQRISRIPVTTQSIAASAIGSLREKLRQRKRDLERLEQMEMRSKSATSWKEQDIQQIVDSRRRTERDFVQRLVQFLRAGNKIDPKTADELNTRYSRKNQLAAEAGGYRMELVAFCLAAGL